jgi:small subunit ribosomal protein S5
MRVPRTAGDSIPHEVEASCCSSRVRLIPAAPGTGIIAGASVRAVCEMAGIKNILTKCYGATSASNVVKATLLALSQVRTRDEVRDLRGVEV